MAKIKLNDTLALYTSSDKNAVANSDKRKLIISTHGGWSDRDGRLMRNEVNGILISFYSSEDYCVTGHLTDALKGKIKTIDSPLTSVKNYELTRFEHDPSKSDIEPYLTDEFDVLKVRTAIWGSRSIHLKQAIQTVQGKGYKYPEVCCLFCRYTGIDKTMSARDRTKAESERLTLISQWGSVTQQVSGGLNRRG